jgi:photosynthetic reaction center cytochrome c subunit
MNPKSRLAACLSVSVILGFGLTTRTALLESNDSRSRNDPGVSSPAPPDLFHDMENSEATTRLPSTIALGHSRALDEDGSGFGPQNTAAPAQQPSPGEKTVDQTEKNIKVLKGMPASQLIPVMNFMSVSLGVNCAACHVGSPGKWEFDKDDKEEKGAARKMIQMTMDINKTSFNNRRQVTCNTCHRGSEHPVGMPSLPFVPQPAAERSAPATRVPLPTADQVIAKYLAAVGGQAALEKQKTRVLTGVQVTSEGTSIPFEMYQAGPDKIAAVLKAPGGGGMSTVFNGTTGYSLSPRGASEITGDQLEILKRTASLYAPAHIAELYPKIRIAGRDKIGDRPVIVAISPISEHVQTRLYFDAENGLLLRVLNLIDTPIARIPQQTDYEDYREVDGVKVPFTVKQSLLDTRSSWTRKFSEIKANVPIEDSKFAPPAKS